MEITITHCRYAPKWEALQTLIRQVTNEPDGIITTLNRVDKGTDYRKPGVYSIKFRLSSKCLLPITLNVVAVGKKKE